MFIPGFTIANLSDEELSAKSAEIARAVVMASRQSISYEAIEQLQAMQSAIVNERIERMQRDQFEQRQAMFPKVIETEPDLRPPVEVQKDKKSNPRPMRNRQRQFGGLTMRRTALPSTEADALMLPPSDSDTDKDSQ